IFRRGDVGAENLDSPILIAEVGEKQLAMKLLQFDEVLHQVGAEAFPHILCNYLYDLASAFMAFYEHCPILKDGVAAEVRASRLRLADITASSLARGLDLLGIEVMEKM